MAQIPTNEEVGMVILKIFGVFGTRPREMLKKGSIISKIEHYGCRIDDVDRGLQWLLDNGHIELRNGNNTLFLTDSGHSLI